MNNVFKKIVTGVATSALVFSMFAVSTPANAATAGGVYSTPDGTVWFVTKDMQKRPFTSAGAFLSYGFLSWAQVMPADASVTALPTGAFIAPADGKIFCAAETKGSDVAGECALITGSQKASFTSAAVFSAQGHTFDRAVTGDSSFLAKTANIDNGAAAHLPGVLINNGGTVQMVVSGGLWGIPSLDVFNSWGYSFADVVPANAADLVKSQVGVIPARMAGELVPTGMTGPVTPGPGNTGFNPNGGTQGSIKNVTLGSPAKSEVLEGQSNVEVYVAEFELENDGALMLQSADVHFEYDNAPNSTRPWTFFTEVCLTRNGAELMCKNAGTSSDWSDLGSDEYRLRFNGVNAVLTNNDTTNIGVTVSAKNQIDGTNLPTDWDLGIEDYRILDESGFTMSENFGDWDGFTVDESEAAELEVRSAPSADEIKAQIVQVSETSDTNGVAIYKFTIEEKNNVSATIQDMRVEFWTGGSTSNESNVFRRARVKEGNTQRGADRTVSDGGMVTFTNMNISLAAKQKKTFTIEVDLKDNDEGNRYQEGQEIEVYIDDITKASDGAGNEIEDMNVSVSADSYTHELRSNGIMLSNVSTSTSANNDGNIGTFTIAFDVTAFGEDQWISADNTACTAGNEVITQVNGSNNGAVCSVSSPGTVKTGNGNYLVTAGQTRRVTITVAVNGDDDFVNVQLVSLAYEDEDDATPDNTYDFNLEDYITGDRYLNL